MNIEYKPSHVGMYGEKQKEKKKPAPKPSPRALKPKPEKAKQTTVTGRKLKTFKFYENDIGPDIKIRKTGPDLPVKEYRYRDPDLLHKPYIEKPFREPTKSKFHENRKIMTPKKYEDYKLTEQNNLGMRHWHMGFVDDTIMRRETDHLTYSELVPKTPEPKPVAAVKPVPKENTEKKKLQTPVKAEHVQPIVAPVPVPVPKKKKLVDSSTQHVPPKNKTSETQTKAASVKTFGTQYEKSSFKHMDVQTDTSQPLPPIVAAGAVMAPPLNKVKSKSVQASEPQKKVAAAGTQYTGPKTKQATMQTSPVLFATPKSPVMVATPKGRRTPSPEVVYYTETLQTRQWSPEQVYRAPSPEATPRRETPQNKSNTPPRCLSDSRWTPPPVVPVVVPVRHDTPPRRQDTPPRTYTPHRTPPRQATPPRQTPPRQATPPRATPPRRDTPQRSTPTLQESMHRITPPKRWETPPHLQTPPRLDSPAHIDPYVFESAGNQSNAPAPSAQKPPTPISPTWSPVLAPVVSTQRPSPERASPNMPRETDYPLPAQTQSPPPVHQPYFTPQREESTPQRQSPAFGNAFQGYLPHNRQLRLPPEVNACIEAYDNAHTDPVRRSGESLPSVKRTMRFA